MDRTKALACLIALVCAAGGCNPGSKPRIVVGSKNFTEQVLLGEILAQQIERRLCAGLPFFRHLPQSRGPHRE